MGNNIIKFCLKCECRSIGELWPGPHCICVIPVPFSGTPFQFQKAWLKYRQEQDEPQAAG